MPRVARKDSVFLDSSVCIAALLSTTGGSFRLFTEANRGVLRLTITRYVQEEVSAVLERKYPAHRVRMDELFRFGNIQIVSNPTTAAVVPYFDLIADPADAPILAGATATKSRFLITLDRRHFMTAQLAKAKLAFIIATPKTFFETKRNRIP